MTTTSSGIISSGALQGIRDRNSKLNRASLSPSSLRCRGAPRIVLLPTGKSFRAFRMIRKSPRFSKSPRLTRWASSRSIRFTTSAMAIDPRVSSFSMAKEQEDDVMRNVDDADVDDEVVGGSSKIVGTVNAVLADIVDGQKFIEETGRTKPRPMKRRALVVCLALGAFRDPLNDVDARLGTPGQRSSTSRLARVPSSGFARTAHLVSQLSLGSASPMNPVADTSRLLEDKTETES